MFNNFKKKFFELSLGEKICRKSDLNEIVQGNGKFFFISGDSDYSNIKKTINLLKLQKENIVVLLKSRLSEVSKKNPKNHGITTTSYENIIIENFTSFPDLLKRLRQNKGKTLFLHYPENINKNNFPFELCSSLANRKKIIGINDYGSAYELNGGFFLYKALLFISWSIPKFCLFLLIAIILTPFVALFWIIMLVIMTLNNAGKKRA